MSAAEKLQKLADVIAPFSYIGAAAPGQAKADVLNALPEIIAVVKATEDDHSLMHPGRKQMMADCSWQPCPTCVVLAALDTELSQ